jgi:hypothetical protein
VENGRFLAAAPTPHARCASTPGAIPHPYTAVTAIERVAGGFSVRAIRGEIRAHQVLIAINGYTGYAFPGFQRRVIPMGSYIIATNDSNSIFFVGPLTTGCCSGRAGFAPTSVERSREILQRANSEGLPRSKGLRLEYAWKG